MVVTLGAPGRAFGGPLDIPRERSRNVLKPLGRLSVESPLVRPCCVGVCAVPLSRPYWKGFLKLSFVSCPIVLYPATSAAERLSFRQVNRRTGHRLKHKLVDSVTGEGVD